MKLHLAFHRGVRLASRINESIEDSRKSVSNTLVSAHRRITASVMKSRDSAKQSHFFAKRSYLNHTQKGEVGP